MFERRLGYHIDWLLIAAVSVVCAIGTSMIYSTTYDPTAGTVGPQFATQFYALLLGGLAFVICVVIDYRVLANNSLFIHGGVLVALVCVLFFGEVIGGAQRWLSVGPVNLQPSEFAKLGLALLLAAYFSEYRRGTVERADLIVVAVLTAVPFVLIAKEPDLGTAVVLLSVALGGTWVAGLRMRWLAALALVALLLAPLAWFALERGGRRAADGGGARRARRRVPTNSGAYHSRVGWPDRERVSAGHAGAVQLPARGAQRFHFFGTSGGARVSWRHRGARAVPIRDHTWSHGCAACEGPLGGLPCRRGDVELCVSGHLQRDHVCRFGARERADAAADELWRVVPDCHTSWIWARRERPDAQVHKLM